MLPPLRAKRKPHQRFQRCVTAAAIQPQAQGWAEAVFSTFTCVLGKLSVLLIRGIFFFKNINISSRADSWCRKAWLNLCFAHKCACVCVCMCMCMCVCACACARQPIAPCPSISVSLPLPCPLKTSNVFFAQLCAGLCVQACVAFPLSCIQSQQQPHTRTTLPCSLRPQLTH